jgi:hypothetical protein
MELLSPNARISLKSPVRVMTVSGTLAVTFNTNGTILDTNPFTPAPKAPHAFCDAS